MDGVTQEKYENIMFLVTVVNIVLGVASVALGTLAMITIRHCNAVERALAVKREPSKELVPWNQRPQATVELPRHPRIRPSVLAENRMRFQDDLWG